MELSKRKPTRLKDYDYSQNGYYFITICAKHRKNILCDIVGGGVGDAPTNNVISHSISTFKRFVNKEIGDNIFQRSFLDHIIRDENDYLRILEYVKNNPLKRKEDCFYEE